MSTSYRVTAPYVTLKVIGHDKFGVQGFYEGAIVDSDSIEEESLKRHLDRGMVEKFAAEPAQAEPQSEPTLDEVMAGNIDEVKAWVGDDKDRAQRALDAEEDGKNRATLISALEDVLTAP